MRALAAVQAGVVMIAARSAWLSDGVGE